MRDIRLVLSDCDGVLTDGKLYYTADEKVMKAFHVRDGMGLKLLQQRGIKTGIITGDPFASINGLRAQHLQLDYIRTGIIDKKACVTEIIEELQIAMHQVAFIGDDVNDLELLQQVGYSACPLDAEEEVKASVHMVCTLPGGAGCVREFTNTITGLIGNRTGQVSN